ncbi:MAG TPA: tetratricopeptide repeat protein [Burkholderiales bacterium]|nr:tetratricopeptide repeat protein [Burkholderiales bacterium]
MSRLNPSRKAVDDQTVSVHSPLTNHQPLARAAAIITLACISAAEPRAGEAEWKLLNDQAVAHLQRGDFEQAGLFARQSLREAETTLGPEHRATEASLSTYSLALRLSGKPEEALPVAGRLVALRTKQYGPEDPATAIALHNSAEILIAQNRFAEAGQMQLRALAVFEKKLGAKHVNTATGLHNMGSILLKQDKYAEAEKYLRRALAAKEQALKPGHLSVAHTLDNLAAALDAQGRNIEADKYRRRAAGIRRKAG